MIGMQGSVLNGNGFKSYGETVLGTEGTLILQRETEAMLFGRFAKTDKGKVTRGPSGLTLQRDEQGDPVSAAVGNMATVESGRGYTESLEHWSWCIRNPAPENRPRCHPEVALANAVVTLTTQMAASMRRRIDFAKQWFDVNSDETPEGVKPDVRKHLS
jgi:hypothetical protein